MLLSFAGPIFAAYKAIRDELAHLRVTGSPAVSYFVAASIEAEVQDMCGLSKYVEIENATT